ncbi:single-stranded-DNA-specific exonuclease RecJ [Lachnospiraceae bacterium BSM-380-WT-5A]|uniref:Single-stranded-DNA-specific exonuclease RecJ n=1 Tax=Oliverpabstia intestinalis TaxID=2606633 RepID=A0A7X2P232_9FIRM|nr:single-stranded-DNA-specific exonuclease RecJ [Oliverpabstia intestinalis]MST65951.1 single-stranded-DNA-specific exonuclease RecJ [Oliverpabstia intestinalis]
MEKWMVAAKRADFKGIGERFGIDQVTARIIRNRDVIGEKAIEKYLHGSRKDFYSPWLLKDMEKAVAILQEKIENRNRIRIIGDYDIDGVMSTYILLESLRGLGGDVDMMIPNRITDGYGINEHLIEQAWQEGRDTIITCDNGIAAVTQIRKAKDLGMTVIVTDHHEVPFEDLEGGRKEILPPADAIVNPKQKACSYPFAGLCGAVVAMKVMEALYEKMAPEVDLVDKMLPFAGIATIGDVMDLQDENRILVKEGLQRLHHTTNLGLQELIRVNNLEPENISPYHIGFILGPCLNASGRLDTAKRALQLLLADSREEAAVLAGDLKNLNESRKEMTAQGLEKAIEQVESTSMMEDTVLVVFLPECHESLAGIIAGRLRERYHKPSFVLTRGEEGVKGSGRSIESYSMYEKLCECKEYLTKFGGHPMAAGLSLEEENVERFRRKLNEQSGLTEEDLVEKVTIDVPMPIHYIRKDLVQELSLLEPFGKGNEKPLFAQKNLWISQMRVFGKNRNVVKMRLTDENGYPMDGVYFGNGDEFAEEGRGKRKISIVYYPDINMYQGRESLQVIIRHYQFD